MAADRGRRGYSLVEGLMASLILAVSLTGIYSLWSVCYLRVLHSGEVNEAGELARQELERAKVFGIHSGSDNAMQGTYSSGTQTGTWSGAWGAYLAGVNPASSWALGTAYYTINGTLTTPSDPNVRYSVSDTVTDYDVLANGSAYAIQQISRREFVVVVSRLPDNTPIFTAGTTIVVGGL